MRMKSTTVLMGDKRISWFNASCTQFEKTPEGYRFTVPRKYKASIKREVFETTMQESEINKYFARFGLVAFLDWYVNLDKILIVKEELIYGAQEKSKISIIFMDGFEINTTLEAAKWSWWKNTYM